MNIWNIRIRDLREDKDLTQTDLAKVLNIQQKTYSQYELDQRKIPIDIIVNIARFYKVSTDYILGVEENNENWKNILLWRYKNN